MIQNKCRCAVNSALYVYYQKTISMKKFTGKKHWLFFFLETKSLYLQPSCWTLYSNEDSFSSFVLFGPFLILLPVQECEDIVYPGYCMCTFFIIVTILYMLLDWVYIFTYYSDWHRILIIQPSVSMVYVYMCILRIILYLLLLSGFLIKFCAIFLTVL